jgi:hypothetical protein
MFAQPTQGTWNIQESSLSGTAVIRQTTLYFFEARYVA